MRALRADDKFQRKQDKQSTNQRAKSAAKEYEACLGNDLGRGHPDLIWNPKRARDITDFGYLFLHRKQFHDHILTALEIIAAKITYVKSDGKDGYFNKLERNVGWLKSITPIVMSGSALADKLCRCGLWANAKNSRRCHQLEICPYCLWIEQVRLYFEAFGVTSDAFHRAPAWFLITISWTTNPANAKCRSSEYAPVDTAPEHADRGYDPYPVVIGATDANPDTAWLGYEDARTLGILIQETFAELRRRDLIHGFHSRLEAEFRLNPGGASRVNLHGHGVANTNELDGQYLADQTQEILHSVWRKHGREHLNTKYFPDINAARITSPEHLQRAVVYTEKILPIAHAIGDAMSRPEARDSDGYYNAKFMADLRTAIIRLLDDDLPAIFSGARLNDDLPPLSRRRTGGNMQFRDVAPRTRERRCIGDEPDWHKIQRKNNAERARKSREERAKRLADIGLAPKKSKRQRAKKRRQRSGAKCSKPA